MGRDVELIARGVCVRRGRILLCRTPGAAHTYLPGGHIEFGESAPRALEREMLEETGRVFRAGAFLGGVEHTFLQKGARHCEFNLVFALSLCGGVRPADVASREDGLVFEWHPVDDLPGAALEPWPLQRCLAGWRAGAPAAARWASTFPRTSGW